MAKPTEFITMTKIAHRVAKETGVTQTKAQEIMWAIFREMSLVLQFQDHLPVKNFGGFSVRTCKGPKSPGAVFGGVKKGERLPDYKKVHFSASFKIE